jgi:uncharacterized protein (TIGR03118 family)
MAHAANVEVSQTNLVTDDQSYLTGLGYDAAAHVDANLIDPRGIAASAASPFWVADHGTDKVTLYNSGGTPQALVVSTPGVGVSGITFNATTNYNSDLFVMSSTDGTISGWRGALGSTAETLSSSFAGGVYTGIAIGTLASGTYLYAADQHNNMITVLPGTGAPALPGHFIDPGEPAGYSPFNVANLGGHLLVTYARAGSEATEPLGTGFIDEFNLDGTFVTRLATGGALASPWGMAIAPSSFGDFAGALLVANHSDDNGFINAFSLADGSLLGQLEDGMGNPLDIPDLWGLQVGNGGNGGSAETLYFTAGLGGGAHGLFGSLSFLSNDSSSNNPAVPEPESWELMLAGFGVIGAVARRRRTTAAA